MMNCRRKERDDRVRERRGRMMDLEQAVKGCVEEMTDKG